jgi:glycosyltransferase involved in cell wall biosynthesis
MRLGFHYHIPAELRGGVIHMPSYLGRFIEGLAEVCDRVICFQHTPRTVQRAEMDFEIQKHNVELVSIGEHCSVPRRMLHTGSFTAPLRARLHTLDALLVRGPSPLLPAFVKAAGDLPTALLLVGSYVDGVDDLPQPRWRKELIRAWFHLNEMQQDKAAARSLTFVNSRRLYERYAGRMKNLVETRTTTLSADDFFVRGDTCESRRVRLLYTGRYDRSKGMTEMVHALAQLVQEGHDVTLDLVGWDDGGSGVIAELMALARRLDVEDRLTDHGRKPVGPALFAHYRSADVYVIASKANEGFPRTIWEAMANSLPVVATSVGSIPHFVGSVAELARPSDAASLAAAIARVITDGALRRERIRAGLEIARANTLEVRCGELAVGIQEWAGSS